VAVASAFLKVKMGYNAWSNQEPRRESRVDAMMLALKNLKERYLSVLMLCFLLKHLQRDKTHNNGVALMIQDNHHL
jgi:hypothetical protein